jgi:hypothetical protein
MRGYEGLFAASDSDYGRTNVVKHNIATGSAHPIKQPPRRLPDVLAKTSERPTSALSFFKNVSFASTNISVSYVSLFVESSTAPFIIISLSAGMTTLSWVSPVQGVVNPNSKIDEEGELRTDLINLLERSQEHLTPKQSSEDKRLLKYLFHMLAYSLNHLLFLLLSFHSEQA